MTVHLDLLDHRSSENVDREAAVERSADVLVDRRLVRCPHCGQAGASQRPVFVGQDGAFQRVDYSCEQCGTEHPIWVD